MKQTCKCGTVIEIDERKYAPGTIVHQECPLCGNMVELKIPDAAKEEAKRLQKEQDANDRQKELEERLCKLQEQVELQQRELLNREVKAAIEPPTVLKPSAPAPISPASSPVPSEDVSESVHHDHQPSLSQQQVLDTSSGSSGLVLIILATFAIIAVLALAVINTSKKVEIPTGVDTINMVADSLDTDESASYDKKKKHDKEDDKKDKKHGRHSKKDADDEDADFNEDDENSSWGVNTSSAYSPGYYVLSGTFSKADFSSPVMICFSSDGTHLYDCEYTNVRAEDGSCNMNITETRDGGLSLSGYDNAGTYFTISVKKRGNKYTGSTKVGKRTWNVNLTLQ